MPIISETFEEYVRRAGVHWTCLKETRRSMKRYLFRESNPVEDTPTLMRGRAAHTMVFEPDRFPIDYAVWRGARRQGKEWDAFCAANKGRTIIKLEEYATCCSMRDAVRAHPVAGKLLAHGRAEQTVTWMDRETGVECKARADWIADFVALCDLKTTTDIDSFRFAGIAGRLGYSGQLSFYREGLRANGVDLPVKIIAVEADEPHDVAVFGLDDDCLYAGEHDWREGLRRVAECRASGVWPGRYEQEVPLVLPSWCYPAEDEADQGLGALGLEVEQEA